MADVRQELYVTEQDVEVVSKILKEAGGPFPIESEVGQDSGRITVSEEFAAWFRARKKRLQKFELQEKIENTEKNSNRQSNEKDALERQERQAQQEEAQEQQLTQNAKKEYMDYQLLTEGNYRIGCLRKIWRRHITYLREEKELSFLSKKTCYFYYLLKEAGEECKVSSMLMAFGNGTGSMDFGRNEECMEGEGKKHIMRTIRGIIISWLALAFIVYLWITADTGQRVVIGLFLVVCMFITLPMLHNVFEGPWLIKDDLERNGKRKKSQQVTAKLFGKFPEFCLEKLISGIDSKLLRLIYADGPEEILDIADGDMTEFLLAHANVVECDIRNIWFTDLREDRNNMYLDVTYQVALDRDLGDRIEQGFKAQFIKLQLARPNHGIMEKEFYNEWKIVKAEIV